MKTLHPYFCIALASAAPLALHAQSEPGELGHPAKDITETTTEEMTGDVATPTDQATGAREVDDSGMPGKSVRQSERDTVDSAGTIMDALGDAENLSQLHELVKAAGLERVLGGQDEGGYTVFAPSNGAFDEVPDDTISYWKDAGNQVQLRRVLLGHVIGGTYNSTALIDGFDLPTAGKSVLTVTRDGDQVSIGEANVTKADIRARNGVIHIIDSVLISESENAEAMPGDAVAEEPAEEESMEEPMAMASNDGESMDDESPGDDSMEDEMTGEEDADER